MFILLGETDAAQEVTAYLRSKKLKFRHLKKWSGKSTISMPTAIFDLSHPSSNNRFANAMRFCEQQNIPYVRLERPETNLPVSPLIFPVYSWEEALDQLKNRVEILYREKNRQVTIFVTTGSHQLESLADSSFAEFTRLVVRVLPEGKLVQKCQDLGIPPKNIVAMQGPYSKDINRALFKFYGADILLTRDSGLAGGTDTKISAALNLGLEIILIKKNKVHTYLTVNNVAELLSWIDNVEANL